MRVHNFKYRKSQKIYAKANSLDYKRIGFLHGVYGLRALESFRLTDKQIESARRSLKKVIKKLGEIHPCVTASLPVSKKPAETRMGKGKGNYSYSVCLISKGTILFELSEVLIAYF